MKEELKEAIHFAAHTIELIVDNPTILKNTAILYAKMRTELMEQGFTRDESIQIITAVAAKGILGK